MNMTYLTRGGAEGAAQLLRALYKGTDWRVRIHEPLFDGDSWRVVVS